MISANLKFNRIFIAKFFVISSAIFLLGWWALLYLSFASNVSISNLLIRDYIKAFLLGILPHTGLWLSITNLWKVNKFWKIVTLFFLLAGVVFYTKIFSLKLNMAILSILAFIGYLIAFCLVLNIIKIGEDKK